MPSPQPKTVLLVDDSDVCRLSAKWFLGSFGYTVEAARSAEAALVAFNPKVHDLVITDNQMPGMSGLEMAHIIKLRSPSTPVLMHTGHPPEDRSCIDGVVQKPAHLMNLKDAIEELFASKLAVEKH